MFKPMLAPNEKVELNDVQYPILASHKFDGIRGLFTNGQVLSRSLKLIPNKQLQARYAKIVKFCDDRGLVLDGEFYNPDITFQQITSLVMTDDNNDPKAHKKWMELSEQTGICIDRDIAFKNLKFYAFDCIGKNLGAKFIDRLSCAKVICSEFPVDLEFVEHRVCKSAEEVLKYFETALTKGFEGLILRNESSGYKCGRGTLKEGAIYKMKPYTTFDAQIVGVVQATKVDPTAERKTNELGRSVTSKKKDDRILIEKAAGFAIMYEGNMLTATLAMTDPEKEDVWANRESYLGRWIEYKGMLVGAKDVPRHPVMVRFRDDK